MKIIITETQFKRLIENILIEQQNNNRTLELLKKKAPMDEWFYENIVKKVKQITYPNLAKIFYVDKNTGQEYMLYDQKNKILFVDDNTILSYFKSNYSTNRMEIQQLIKDLVGEHYGLGDITVV